MINNDDLLFDDPLPPNPLTLLQEWFDYAKTHSQKHHWHAFMLATADPENLQPSVRTVLMKDYSTDSGALTFYTNYNSRKAREINGNPRVEAAFHWDSIVRQVRLRGSVQLATPEVSDAYFATRARESQIGAWASDQSAELNGWEDLLSAVLHHAMKYPGDEPVPRPPYWGGYVLIPDEIEFWHGRDGRVHERISYFRQSDKSDWRSAWIAP